MRKSKHYELALFDNITNKIVFTGIKFSNLHSAKAMTKTFVCPDKVECRVYHTMIKRHAKFAIDSLMTMTEFNIAIQEREVITSGGWMVMMTHNGHVYRDPEDIRFKTERGAKYFCNRVLLDGGCEWLIKEANPVDESRKLMWEV